jgi:2-octaprenyl-6-methoxyphenol hydroxylase
MTNKKSHSADIIISGGGIAGLSLACILGEYGISVALIEPNPPSALKDTNSSGRTIALMQSSLNVLRAAGLSDFIDQYGTPMHTMRLMDDSIAGQPVIQSEFESAEIGLPYFGMNIPNSLLRATLFDRLQKIKSASIFFSALKTYTADTKITATLEDDTQISAPLIIGADGRHSLIRKIAGISTWKKDYGQSAITCIINHSRSHDNTSTEFHRAGGPFALVPMIGNQSSVVWVERTEQADAMMRLPRDAFEQALQERTNNILGGITLETPPESWPLCTIKAKSLIAPRVALMAEAAHVMSPITAQGLNLSLRDAATLAEIIVDAMRLGMDHGNQITLHKYEKRRSLDIATRVMGVNGMNQIVSTDFPALKDIRRNGLKLVERIQPLKIFAMNHGLAPSLDQDRILKGLLL